MLEMVKMDFEQARTKHILFKSRLRAILYGTNISEEPVLSQYECGVGKWIYGHALEKYGHIPEMRELEIVHSDIHEVARELVALYKSGKTEEARNGLAKVEEIADKLVTLLTEVEAKIH